MIFVPKNVVVLLKGVGLRAYIYRFSFFLFPFFVSFFFFILSGNVCEWPTSKLSCCTMSDGKHNEITRKWVYYRRPRGVENTIANAVIVFVAKISLGHQHQNKRRAQKRSEVAKCRTWEVGWIIKSVHMRGVKFALCFEFDKMRVATTVPCLVNRFQHTAAANSVPWRHRFGAPVVYTHTYLC